MGLTDPTFEGKDRTPRVQSMTSDQLDPSTELPWLSSPKIRIRSNMPFEISKDYPENNGNQEVVDGISNLLREWEGSEQAVAELFPEGTNPNFLSSEHSITGNEQLAYLDRLLSAGVKKSKTPNSVFFRKFEKAHSRQIWDSYPALGDYFYKGWPPAALLLITQALSAKLSGIAMARAKENFDRNFPNLEKSIADQVIEIQKEKEDLERRRKEIDSRIEGLRNKEKFVEIDKAKTQSEVDAKLTQLTQVVSASRSKVYKWSTIVGNTTSLQASLFPKSRGGLGNFIGKGKPAISNTLGDVLIESSGSDNGASAEFTKEDSRTVSIYYRDRAVGILDSWGSATVDVQRNEFTRALENIGLEANHFGKFQFGNDREQDIELITRLLLMEDILSRSSATQLQGKQFLPVLAKTDANQIDPKIIRNIGRRGDLGIDVKTELAEIEAKDKERSNYGRYISEAEDEGRSIKQKITERDEKLASPELDYELSRADYISKRVATMLGIDALPSIKSEEELKPYMDNSELLANTLMTIIDSLPACVSGYEDHTKLSADPLARMISGALKGEKDNPKASFLAWILRRRAKAHIPNVDIRLPYGADHLAYVSTPISIKGLLDQNTLVVDIDGNRVSIEQGLDPAYEDRYTTLLPDSTEFFNIVAQALHEANLRVPIKSPGNLICTDPNPSWQVTTISDFAESTRLFHPQATKPGRRFWISTTQ